MKKSLIIGILGLFYTIKGYAQDFVLVTPGDTAQIPSLEEIIAAESSLTSKLEIESQYKNIWGKSTYLNISISNTEFSSSVFPTDGGNYKREYKNKMGFGIQSGRTYNFHKKPIGTVLFIGIDYTPLDLNFNMFDEEEASPEYHQTDEEPFCLPWHQKKTTVDYGMALGPSLTFYPFTAINNNITNNIRLQFYYHIGYHIGFGSVDKVGTNESSELLWGTGPSTTYGFNLTWNFVGIGYERRQFNKFTYHSVGKSYDTGNVECKQTNNRLYIQFRF